MATTSAGASASENEERVAVVLETPLGRIELEIDAAAAPITAANFLGFLDNGAFDGGRFHRTVTPDNQPDSPVKIEVIQADINPAYPRDGLAPIPLERTTITGLHHHDGTISMGRFEPDSALDNIFICIGDQPELDYGGRRNPDGQGFAAFGHVTAGMDVVRAIQHAPHEDQRLTPPISITHAYRALNGSR